MVNIEPINSIHNEKNESFQEEIKTIVDDVENLVNNDSPISLHDSKVEERLLDAQAIEQLATNIDRPSARVHLDALVNKLRSDSISLSSLQNAVVRPVVKFSPTRPPSVSTSVKYIPINKFALDLGGYNSPFVTLYLEISNVGAISKENISCHFKNSSFDLIVNDLQGKNYRLLKDNLDKEIDPEKSKYIVKKHKIVIKLAKVKAEYGSYDSWQSLSSKKSKKSKEKMKANPSDSIMEMMKDMYESGDDNMRKVIGETMLKQRNGELGKDRDMPSYPGMDNMDI